MRKIYTTLLYLLIPFIILRLLWKSRKLPEYRHRMTERFGLHKLDPVDIWVHAVSMGEVVAATPLVERCLAQNLRVLITTMTPTGSQQVITRFKSRVSHQYIPYDLPSCLRRFFKQAQPKLGIIMETELWPNMIYEAYSAHILLGLVNGRLSDKAFAQYQYMQWFFAPFLEKFAWIGTQSDLDAQRYQQLGGANSTVLMLGNVKFDLADLKANANDLSPMKTAWGEQRPVWVAASTHDNEEAQLLAQLSKIKQAIPDILLVLVPRHPERFQAVYHLAKQQGWKTGLRSDIASIQNDSDVVVMDSMGELLQCYRLCDYAFVGGSLVPIGGHNVLEPIAMQVPVFCGPYMQNAQSICDDLVKNKALQCCASAEEVAHKLIALYQNPSERRQQIEQASLVLQNNRGAVDRYWTKISEIVFR